MVKSRMLQGQSDATICNVQISLSRGVCIIVTGYIDVLCRFTSVEPT